MGTGREICMNNDYNVFSAEVALYSKSYRSRLYEPLCARTGFGTDII